MDARRVSRGGAMRPKARGTLIAIIVGIGSLPFACVLWLLFGDVIENVIHRQSFNE
jgi:hypothetical protein